MTLRIVHVVAHPFFPAEDGGRLKTACVAASLARRGDLHWVSLDDHHRAKGSPKPEQTLELPWGGRGTLHSLMHVSAKRRIPRSPGGWWRAAKEGVRFPLAWMPYTRRHGEAMAQIARIKPDLVVADETILAPFAVFAPARWKVIITQNHDSKLFASEVFGGGERGHFQRVSGRLHRFERRLFPRVDQVWGVKEEDLAAYHALGVARERLFMAPNVVPDHCFIPDPKPGAPGRAAFFGSMWYPPNQQALERLLALWPALRQRVPGAQLQVAGRGIPDSLAAKAAQVEGVSLLGFVPDIQAFLREAALAVIPLEAGGGTKLKTIEAMASGKPVLATPVAAEGLGVVDGQHALIRSPGEAFLDAIVGMITAPEAWQDMALRGQALARDRFSVAALHRAVDGALDRLLGI